MIAAANIAPLFIVISLGGAFLISLLEKRMKHFPYAMGLIVTGMLLILSLAAVKAVGLYRILIYNVGSWKPPLGITLVIDGFSAFMLVTVNLIAFLIAIYSGPYMERYTSKGKFFALFLLMVAGMNGVVITGDIFNLFVFLEIASIASFALVAFGTGRHELEASFKYTLMSAVGSLFILLGIGLLYSFTSTLNMADIACALLQKGKSNISLMVAVMFIMGFGLKAALVPFHGWLPDAHPSAPAPISAMLSGVLIKSLGVYTLCRLFFNVLGMDAKFSAVLMFLGALSMTVGVFSAIGQWDFKRLLAYHSISQIGYVFLGIGLGTPLGILGGLFHLFNHSVFKSLLFLNSGAVEYAAKTRDLRKMGGLAQKMPVTGATALVASMSIAGIPPLNGFWSKLIIIVALVDAGRFGYAFLAVLVSIMTLASFAKVMKYAFGGEFNTNLGDIKEVPGLMRLSMTILAAICVIGGILGFAGAREIFLGKAGGVLQEGINHSLMILGGIK